MSESLFFSMFLFRFQLTTWLWGWHSWSPEDESQQSLMILWQQVKVVTYSVKYIINWINLCIYCCQWINPTDFGDLWLLLYHLHEVEMSQQLLDGFPWYFVHTLMSFSNYIIIYLASPSPPSSGHFFFKTGPIFWFMIKNCKTNDMSIILKCTFCLMLIIMLIIQLQLDKD